MAIPKSAGPHLPWGALDMSARMRDGYCCGPRAPCLKARLQLGRRCSAWQTSHTLVQQDGLASSCPSYGVKVLQGLERL